MQKRIHQRAVVSKASGVGRSSSSHVEVADIIADEAAETVAAASPSHSEIKSNVDALQLGKRAREGESDLESEHEA